MKILIPFKVIHKKPGLFFLWFVFTLLAGLLGPIINIIYNYFFEDIGPAVSIAIDSMNGTFYTYSIVIISSAIGGLFIKLISEDFSTHFKNVKLFFIAVSIFPMLFGGVLYSGLLSHRAVMPSREILKYADLSIDTPQLIIFFLALVLAVYAFCLEYITFFPEDFEVLSDNYHSKDDEIVKEINNQAKKQEHTKTGIKL